MPRPIDQSQGASVGFSNYTYAFLFFNKMYIALCSKISVTMSLRKVRANVSTFMYEFSYAVPSNWEVYQNELDLINKEISEDTEFSKVMEKSEMSFREEVSYYPSYYNHLIKYLSLMGRFVSELAGSYLPKNKYQRKMLMFNNDSPFYEKLHEYKGEVYQQLSDFNLVEFRQRFNSFLIFFYAYSMYINEKNTNQILKVCSNILSIFIHRDTIDVLAKHPNYSKDDLQFLYTKESELHTSILYCNSLINDSLSSYGVLPKLLRTIYQDRTLI